MQLVLTEIESPKRKYRREIWAGIRKTIPTLSSLLHPNGPEDSKTIEQFLNEEPKLFPAMLEWETSGGRLHYVEVTKID